MTAVIRSSRRDQVPIQVAAPPRPDHRLPWVATAVIAAMQVAPDVDRVMPGVGAKVVGAAALGAVFLAGRHK